jgi:hypothetical protein
MATAIRPGEDRPDGVGKVVEARQAKKSADGATTT